MTTVLEREALDAAPPVLGPVRRTIRDHPYLVVFVVALVIRIAMAVVLSSYAEGLVADDGTYDQIARSKAAGQSGAWDPYTSQLFRDTATFSGPLWIVYELTGSRAIFGQLMVALVGALVAVGSARFARNLVGPGLSLAIGLTMALFPSLVLWSSLTLKDSFVWLAALAIAGAVVSVLDAEGRARVGWMAVLTVLLFATAHLRAHSFVVVCMALALVALVHVRRDPRLALALLAIGTLVPLVDGKGPVGVSYAASRGSLEVRRYQNAVGAETAIVPVVDPDAPVEVPTSNTASTVVAGDDPAEPVEPTDPDEPGSTPGPTSDASGGPSTTRVPRTSTTTRAGSGGPATSRVPRTSTSTTAAPPIADPEVEVEVSRVGGVSSDLKYLPHGLRVMLLDPLPWEPIDNSRVRLALLENLLWYPMLLLAVAGLALAGWRNRRWLLFPVFYGGGMVVLYALSEGNFGTAYRHRSEVMWVVVILAGVGVHELRARRLHRRTEADSGTA